MSENMLTIDRLFDFGVLGFLDAYRLSDSGVFEGLIRVHFQQTPVLAALAGYFSGVGNPLAIKNKRTDFLGPLAG